MKRIFILLILTMVVTMAIATDNPVVVFETTMGNIEIELYPKDAPVGVDNFLNYVNSGFYSNTIFHRVINGFMIQGGGFDKDTGEKENNPPIINEATNGLKNTRGAICYARTNVVNSATSQFFLNHRDNAFLDHQNTTQSGFGYAVFGKVIKGMDVIDKIAKVKTGNVKLMIEQQGRKFENLMENVPLEPVIVKIARELTPDPGIETKAEPKVETKAEPKVETEEENILVPEEEASAEIKFEIKKKK